MALDILSTARREKGHEIKGMRPYLITFNLRKSLKCLAGITFFGMQVAFVKIYFLPSLKTFISRPELGECVKGPSSGVAHRWQTDKGISGQSKRWHEVNLILCATCLHRAGPRV